MGDHDKMNQGSTQGGQSSGTTQVGTHGNQAGGQGQTQGGYGNSSGQTQAGWNDRSQDQQSGGQGQNQGQPNPQGLAHVVSSDSEARSASMT